MDEARDSISHTVTEIRDTVVQQYESVKETISETLDWREQFRKQPLAWGLGAVGASFVTGYALAAIIKGPVHDHDHETNRRYDHGADRRSYIAQPVLGPSSPPTDNTQRGEPRRLASSFFER
jgi:hypothetical protein